MEYLKKELNKLLPLAMLFGAVGGVLLIILGNVFFSDKWTYLITYIAVIGLGVFILNAIRFKKEILSSVLYGYCIFFVMTTIAWFDMQLNADPNFTTPVFEKVGFFLTLFISVFCSASLITFIFKRRAS